MSHQTGITANKKLSDFLGTAKDGKARVIKISIVEEKLVLDDYRKPSGSWEDDYEHMITLGLLKDDVPCYLLFRFDSKNNQGFEWLFISYSPDYAQVRQKMLYAGTRATMKREFGIGHIKNELFGTTLEDVSLKGYQKHLEAQNAPPPLTLAEAELKEIRRTEINTASVSTKHQTASSISFPLTVEATESLHALRNGSINYVQLNLDTEKESIGLALGENIDISQLPSKVPKDEGRYHVYNFKHSHEGDCLESKVFIYSMPGYNCPIKQRMLYSSCKNSVTQFLEDEIGLELAKKMEIDDGAELTKDFIYEEIHPTKTVFKQKFERPKGPASRGPKRMMKKT